MKVINKDLTISEVLDLRFPFYTSLLLNLVMAALLIFGTEKIKHIYHTKVVTNIREDVTLNDSALLKELVHLKCVLPNIALAQIKIESSHYKSIIAIENKNICGIKTSKSKYVIGQNRGHCVYNTYRDCLRDYVRIQNAYLKNINHKYAEANGYVDLIKRMK